MELLYLWIDNDRMTIKNQSFNFSNHIFFHFDKPNDTHGELILTENPNYIPYFFGNSLHLLRNDRVTEFTGGIVNVTGIIGENGVGKTNLLSFIIDLLTDKLPIGEKFVVVFKDNKNKLIKIYHTLKNFKLTTTGFVSGFEISDPVEQTLYEFLEYSYLKEPEEFVGNIGLIYYNPILDLRNYPPLISNENKKYVDVSTNALIENDVIRNGDIYPEKVNELELHKYSNIRRQFDMVINSGLANISEINLPDEVKVQFHRNYFDPDAGQKNLTFESEAIFKHLDQLVVDAWQKVNSTLSSIDKRHDRDEKNRPRYHEYSKNHDYRKALAEKLKIEFSYSFIHNFFHNLSKHYDEDIGIKFEEIQGNSFIERTKYFFENQKWDGRNNQYVQTKSLFTSIIDLIDAVDFDKNWIEDDADSFITDITGGVISISNYEHYIKSIPSDSKINFISTSWRNLSTGENALMDLYSRLYFAKNYKFKEQIEKRNRYMKLHQEDLESFSFIYILIDEGEAGFHPQWQSEYIFNLTKFVRNLFPEYQVQIILTSHSPFVVSDLPKENLIFLEKEKGLCKVVSLNEEQTFAANIHSLFANQFFMKEGVIGKFARIKLQEELKPLLDEPPKKFDEQRLKKIIALIGEPVLQSKLTEILTSKTKN